MDVGRDLMSGNGSCLDVVFCIGWIWSVPVRIDAPVVPRVGRQGKAPYLRKPHLKAWLQEMHFLIQGKPCLIQGTFLD